MTVDLPPTLYAYGFSQRKRAIARRFLFGHRIQPVRGGRGLPPRATLLLWGATPIPDGTPPDIVVVRVEDGFLRSVGLGADLVRPMSWVLDDQGIYFDSSRRSRLETLLSESDFSPDLLLRAANLRRRIVATGVTKYNVGTHIWLRPRSTRGGSMVAQEVRVILVAGQVESDASLRLGAPGIRHNIDLLRAVRVANPDAYIVYKPHPDVAAGLRSGGADESSANRWCDEILADVALGELLHAVDEVHVLTSLCGFEALLRGRSVTCYGQPFYAGWGLTNDICPPSRRTRRLTLDQLVAGALILYPRYASLATGQSCAPEQALDELLAWRARSGSMPSVWRRLLRLVLRHLQPVG